MEINTLQQMANKTLLRLGVTNTRVTVIPVEYNTIAGSCGIIYQFQTGHRQCDRHRTDPCSTQISGIFFDPRMEIYNQLMNAPIFSTII